MINRIIPPIILIALLIFRLGTYFHKLATEDSYISTDFWADVIIDALFFLFFWWGGFFTELFNRF